MDPLEEPEVLLVKNLPLKDKEQMIGRPHRQCQSDIKKKSQNKKLLEKEVKQEPVDIDSKLFIEETTTEVEVAPKSGHKLTEKPPICIYLI